MTDLFILKFGLYFSLSFLLPYLSVLIGSQLFSLIHFSKARNYNNSEYLKFAKYLTEVVTKRVWVRVVFGILPFLGVTFFYSQLYSMTSNDLVFAFVLFVAGICLSVFYKGSFNIKEVDDSIKSKDMVSDNFTFRNAILLHKGGWFGLILLFISSFIVISYLQLIATFNGVEKYSLLSIMFTSNNIIYYLLFVTISFSISSAVIVARMNRTKENYSFKSYAKEFAVKTGILFTFIQPILFVLNIFSVSASALSFSFFVTSLFVLLIMLIISIQFYLNFKSENSKGTSIVFVFLILFSFLIYNAQITSENVDKKEAVKKNQIINLFS